MLKSIGIAIAAAALGSAGGNAALACGGGGCGNSAACSSQAAAAVAAQSSGGTRLYNYEPGNRATAPAYGRASMMGGSASPSLGIRPADAKPLGRLP